MLTYTGTTGTPGTIANMNGPQIVTASMPTPVRSGVRRPSSSHTLTNTLTLGDAYTASISVGRRGVQHSADVSLGNVFELLAGSTVIASAIADGSALPNDAFTVFSISHIAVGSDPIGQALTIVLGVNVPSPDAQRTTDFDALSITETVAPEPASLSLVALASLGLLRRRRA